MICVSVLRQLDWGKTKIDQGVWEEDAHWVWHNESQNYNRVKTRTHEKYGCFNASSAVILRSGS